jgi:hypothetical protein
VKHLQQHHLHWTADAFAALAMWGVSTGIAELIVKPLWRRAYRQVDQATGDRLPDLR